MRIILYTLGFWLILGIIFLFATTAARSIQSPGIHVQPRCAGRPLPPDVTCFDIPYRGLCYVVTSTIMRSELKTISCVIY